MAVASNNLVCLNKDQNVFDSKKRIKLATTTELDYKLNSIQRCLIAYNEILFSIITNQVFFNKYIPYKMPISKFFFSTERQCSEVVGTISSQVQ